MVIKRDTPVKKVITDLTNGLDKLNAAAVAFSGNIQPVVDAADFVISLIGSGKTTTDGVVPIGLGDAAALIDPFKELDNHAKTLYNDVKGLVADVEKTKQCDVIREKLSTINTAGQKLLGAIVNKMTSTFARGQIHPYLDDINGLLVQSQEVFAEGECINAA